MNLADYMQTIRTTDRNKSLMCRVVLNAMAGSKQEPLDISELRLLSPRNRALTFSFLNWTSSNHNVEPLSEERIKSLKAEARKKT